MKNIKLHIGAHAEITIYVSEQMETDMKKCFGETPDNRRCDSDSCSWFELDIFGVGLCEIAAITNEVLGKKEGCRQSM